MTAIERIIVGMLGVCFAAMLMRDLRRGVIEDEDAEYRADSQPIRFTLTALISLAGIVFCAYCAAGYSSRSLWEILLAD